MNKQPGGPTVFVVEHMPFDYTPAAIYGELRFLEAERLAPHSPNAPETWNNSVVKRLERGLGPYVPGYDFVIPTGAPTRMMLVGMLLSRKGDKHKILKWDARSQRYSEYIIIL